jgi:ABC-2 type transport system permease protein
MIGKVWYIAWKDMLIRFRDRRGLLMNFLFPLVLIGILGMAGRGQMGQSDLVMDMKVAVYNEDSGKISQNFIEQVLQGSKVKEHITLVQAADAKEVQRLVDLGEADVGLSFKQGFSDQIQKGEASDVELYQDPGKTIPAQVVSSMVDSYCNRVAAASSAVKGVLKSVSPADLAKISQEVSASVTELSQNPNVSVERVSTGGKQLTALEYYSAAEVVLFLLFNAQNGAMSIINERTTETLGRLMSTPTAKAIILVGKFVGVFLYTLMQFLLLLLATRYLFGVHWGDQIGQLIVVGVMFTSAIAGTSLWLASFSLSEKAMESTTRIGIYLMGLLGGSMIPLYSFSDQIRTIAHLMPNYWALNSFLDILSGTSTWQSLLPVCALMGGITLFVLSLGTWRLKLR